MRTIDRIGAAMAGFALAAAPVAFAATPAIDDPAEAGPATERGDGRAYEALYDMSAKRARDIVSEEERGRRPVHPVAASAVDYGEAGAQFGASRGGRAHEGQDVFAPAGTPLVAVADGEVIEAGTDGGRGNYVSIYDPAEERTYSYFHMVRPASVDAGERVRAGQRVGAVGCTGSCWGDHLHFEVHEGRDPYGPAVDPLPLLSKLPPADG
jgi:murein DD-endopeptidase MepM/ murein hydrolase activator NlpD